ncbi:MAG TPA: hypothetical protein VFV38_16410 [Ktedonobacteraceae bacterium]|nr:hypothetical protein [Ktedonobacteraceae bacterium]
MAQQHALTLRVNDRCTLSAGSWQTERDEQQESFRLVSSPEPPMYQQLLASLAEATKDQKVPPKSHLHFGEVALATVLVCIRWGSYFAVLVNPDQPQWAPASDPEVSCIGDSEMARINIEASAALAAWIDLMRLDNAQFRKMVKAALQLLPSVIPVHDPATNDRHFRAFSAFNSADGRQYLMEAYLRDFGEKWVAERKRSIPVNPSRALANGVLHEYWRNGEIEDIHAGRISTPWPLTQRRLTLQQEERVVRETAARFVPTMRALYNVVTKPSQESWPEQALPYAIAFKPPDHWSLDEQTRETTLPDAEPV